MLSKPSSCGGCALYSKSTGFSHPVGPSSAKILLLGEALGDDEAQKGVPFVGRAGQKLNSFLRRAGIDREECRIYNTIQCQPPYNKLDRQQYEQDAVNHCRIHRESVLEEPHQVVVTIGAVSTRTVLNLQRKDYRGDYWHGTVNRDPLDRFWVVPTYHPAYVLRGNHKLTGTVIHDLIRAKEVADEGWTPDPGRLVIDPPLDWFRAWVDAHLAAGGSDPWLAIDIETTDKLRGGDEQDLEANKTDIIRINFSNDPQEGITVPWQGEYIEQAVRLFQARGPKLFWNARYDIPIIKSDLSGRGVNRNLQEPVLDFMWGWHVLQSDLPRGLGFVAPFYSSYGPWKHLSGSDPSRYAAIDAIQTIRCAIGITNDLKQQGQWEAFYRHVYELDTRVLHPAEEIGLLADKEELERFTIDLQSKEDRVREAIQAIVPAEVCKLTVKKTELDGYTSRMMQDITKRCFTCEETDIASSHACKPVCRDCGHVQQTKRKTCSECKAKNIQQRTPNIKLVEWEVERWVRQEPFNPASPVDVLRYIEFKGQKPGRSKGSKQPSTDEKALTALYTRTKDPFYKLELEFREIAKVLGTYAEGTEKRADANNRLHTQFLHVPSTLRLSSRDPNLQNVVGDKDGPETAAAGFRRVLVAASGCSLVEADATGIEAVLTGWFARDPDYIRLTGLDIHSYLTSHLVGRPARPDWDDEKLLAHLRGIKKKYPRERYACKRTVHLTNYGGTPHIMVASEPETFTSLSHARKLQDLYFAVCPRIKQWWNDLRQFAHKHGYVGGSDHPFRYKHWFWNVYNYNSKSKAWTLGDDAKRAVAFLPQSTAAGILYDTCLELTDPGSENYIGEIYNGKTPIRALVHDSILSEVPERGLDEYVHKVRTVMTRPIKQLPMPAEWDMGEYLQIGCEIKAGKNWMEMEVV